MEGQNGMSNNWHVGSNLVVVDLVAVDLVAVLWRRANSAAPAPVPAAPHQPAAALWTPLRPLTAGAGGRPPHPAGAGGRPAHPAGAHPRRTRHRAAPHRPWPAQAAARTPDPSTQTPARAWRRGCTSTRERGGGVSCGRHGAASPRRCASRRPAFGTAPATLSHPPTHPPTPHPPAHVFTTRISWHTAQGEHHVCTQQSEQGSAGRPCAPRSLARLGPATQPCRQNRWAR